MYDGLVRVLVTPSPKLHSYVPAFRLLLVKSMAAPRHTGVVEVKAAAGSGLTVTVLEVTSNPHPNPLVAVSHTVYVPALP